MHKAADAGNHMKYFSPSTRRAFTIIELIIATSVLGILTAVVTANLSESRAKARDANRTESVRAYSSALEQWRSSNGNYFVYLKSAGGAPSCSAATDGSGYMTCNGVAAVGFRGGSGGGITRKNDAAAEYKSSSIADALMSGGFLTEVRLDPLDTAFNTRTTAASKHSDFILTLCASSSEPASSPRTAQEYAIYTTLERPDTPSQPTAQTHCGGPDTPSNGWDTLIAR
jgi:prepilin-type N-terminal cleavage/methylation domain-containing protein